MEHGQIGSAATASLADLRTRMDGHPFWSNSLLQACKNGQLTREDFRFIFSQYYLYSRNFTRYLNGLMTNCESDLLRSRLNENLWEEGGGADPAKRHAQIFRNFLIHGLGLVPEKIVFTEFTQLFVREYLDFSRTQPPAQSSAFLALGTEAIVSRLYGVMVEGLKAAGVEEEHLEFFRIHMACDDAHAATLEEIMLSYSGEPAWVTESARGMNVALELRHRFFESLYQEVQRRRVQTTLDRIQARASLTPADCTPAQLHFRDGTGGGEAIYANVNERLNIEFAVTRIPFPAEVLDPRVVKIPAGKFNENHKHAHETVFVVLRGAGEVHVDGRVVPVKQGDLAFVPRWSMHQSRNTGSEELVLLALADYGLTGKAFVGDYLKTARLTRGDVAIAEANVKAAAPAAPTCP